MSAPHRKSWIAVTLGYAKSLALPAAVVGVELMREAARSQGVEVGGGHGAGGSELLLGGGALIAEYLRTWHGYLTNREASHDDRKEAEATAEVERLFNHDLARAVGVSLQTILRGLAAAGTRSSAAHPAQDATHDTPPTRRELSRSERAALQQIADRAPAAWLELAQVGDTAFAPLCEDEIADAVVPNPDQPGFPPVGDAAMWNDLLRALRDAARQTAALPDDAPGFRAAAAALAAGFARQLYNDLKHDFATGGRAFAAVHLRMIGELVARSRRTEKLALRISRQVGDVAATTSEMKHAIGRLLADVAKISARLPASDEPARAAELQKVGDWLGAIVRGQKAAWDNVDDFWFYAWREFVAVHAKLDRIDANAVTAAAAATRAADNTEPHAPILTLPQPPTDKTRDRLVFRSEWLKVVGRYDELQELSDWLDLPAPFGWDLWVGPAGSGKSRLALELCRQRSAWNRGFFHWTDQNHPNWARWQPRTHTLIIFDYVAEHADQIGDIVDILTRRAASSGGDAADSGLAPWPAGIKVRCLLLERAAARVEERDASGRALPPAEVRDDAGLKAPWLLALRAAVEKTGARVEETYQRKNLQNPGRYLGGVNPVAALSIVLEEAVAADPALAPLVLARQMVDDEATRKTYFARADLAHRIDPHLRPLFVAMAARAHRDRGGVQDFDELVEHIRGKEWKHAKGRLAKHPDGVRTPIDAWGHLVCVATMCQGLTGAPRRKVLKQLSENGGPLAGEWGDGSRYDRLVSGASKDHAPQMEPDLVGEAFVLHWLAEHPDEADALIELAWASGMSGFVARCAQNFPAQTEARGLLEPVAVADPAALAAAQTALADREYTRGDLAALRSRGRRLLTATQADGGTPLHPPRVRALGAFMWMQDTPTPHELALFTTAVDDLLAAGDLDEPTRVDLAKGLNNSILHAGADHARAGALLARPQQLANEHPQDAAVRELLAKGLFNAFNKAPANSDRADALLARLQQLPNEHPQDAAVREKLAKGLYNAFHRAPDNRDWAGALLARLQQLATEHPQDAAVREQLASGLYNAIIDAPANSNRADALLARLQQLANEHPQDAAVRERLAKGLFNAFCDAPANSDRADALLARLRHLADEHPQDAAVRGPLAKGLFNAFNNAPANSERAHALLARLQYLANAHPRDAAVREQLAKGLYNAFFHAGADHARADALLARLQQLADAHPQDAAVAKPAWKGVGTAFLKSREPGPPQPRHLRAMATVLPPLAGDTEVRDVTPKFLALVVALVAEASEPLKSELDAARAVLERAYQATFGRTP